MAGRHTHYIILTFGKMSHIKSIKINHALQLSGQLVWIITGAPGPDFRPEHDLPMEVMITDIHGTQLAGQILEGVRTRLIDIDPDICRAATGLGNAMFIGQQPVGNMARMVAVWKIQTHTL
ncbi:MAG: hypothetical protein H7A09_10740 [Oceanospirillaceae bacterium]|nr:hypothetical protein [Oceanospirillaceae bacterium]